MPNPRLMAVVTALLMISGMRDAHAAYTVSDLRKIEALISAGDCAGLWSFLSKNPQIYVGDDPLAVELRNFVNGINNGLIQCVSLPQRQQGGFAKLFGLGKATNAPSHY